MGIRGKTRRAEKRKMEKKAAKARKRALYEQYAKEGKEKGIRQRKSIYGCGASKGMHREANCGNPGCFRCNPGWHSLPNGERLRRLVEAGNN